MGFLDSIFGGNKEKEIDSLKLEFAALKAELSKNASGVRSEIDQIITILSQFDEDMNALKRQLKKEKPYGPLEKIINGLVGVNLKNEKSLESLRTRLENIEKLGESLKVMGKLTLQNYDAMKAASLKLKKLDKIDEIEKAVREHISVTPETVVSKDEYDEEISSLRDRLEDLEKNETVLLSAERKRAKSNKSAGR